METIYDWLYAHYYQPHAEEVLGAYGDMGAITEEAERLLLTGEGSELERQDAINTLQRLNGGLRRRGLLRAALRPRHGVYRPHRLGRHDAGGVGATPPA